MNLSRPGIVEMKLSDIFLKYKCKLGNNISWFNLVVAKMKKNKLHIAHSMSTQKTSRHRKAPSGCHLKTQARMTLVKTELIKPTFVSELAQAQWNPVD